MCEWRERCTAMADPKVKLPAIVEDRVMTAVHRQYDTYGVQIHVWLCILIYDVSTKKEEHSVSVSKA